MRRRCSRMHFNPRSPDGERRGARSHPCSSAWHFNPRSPDGERLGLLIVIIYFQIFQSTLPGWGATIQSSMWPVSWKFQSTLPGWGATCPRRCRSCRRWHFNPRSPDGERLRGHVPPVRRVRISIHAPRMGSDSWRPRATVIIMIFQSTLPGWGATLMLLEAVHGIVISIHAPRMGSDRLISDEVAQANEFQSTLPGWGATIHRPWLGSTARISIHAPRMGSDSMLGVQMLSGYDDFNPRSPDGERPGISISVVPEALISIHAPRMGSDVYVPRLRFVSRDFNPRSPDGERPIGRPYPRSLIYFNPRSPDGERQVNLSRIVTGGEFQSTLPGWGATEARPRHGPPDLFQSTLPGWGATSGLFHTVTPRSFQSTLPGWGATCAVGTDVTPSALFQSTLPGWGATF